MPRLSLNNKMICILICSCQSMTIAYVLSSDHDCNICQCFAQMHNSIENEVAFGLVFRQFAFCLSELIGMQR